MIDAEGRSGIDSIMLGHISQKAHSSDSRFGEQPVNCLFNEDPPNGLGADLPALNIQRGRDHGLPCELSTIHIQLYT